MSKTFTIPLTIDLSLKPNTNFSTLTVEYTIGSSTKKISFKYPDTKYVIINRTHPPETKFFLSHKDPEDNPIASRHNYYLNKIGFEGFMAEHNQLPGMDIWNEKIYPSIDDCRGLIVLWTGEADKNPDMILKEVKYAKKADKRIIALVEDGIDVPNILAGERERLLFRSDEAGVIKTVRSIDDAYRRGVFRS